MEIIDRRNEVKSKAYKFIEKTNHDVAIIGRNKYGISLQNWLEKNNRKVVAYIDDFTSDDIFNGLPVIKSDSYFDNTAIINCATERTIDVNNLISKMNATDSIDYFALQLAYPDELSEVDYLENTDIISNEKKSFIAIYSHLADEVSRDEYQSVLNFRLNRDIRFMDTFKFKIREQYFEPFLKLPADAAFVDGGGYDAETTLEFIKHQPDYTKVYYFEPTVSSMNLSQKRLKAYPNIEYYQKGLWSTQEVLQFENALGTSNRISGTGEVSIEATSIDRTINEKVDFIKLDIEGAEIEALKGAKDTIKKQKPKLAVCVYHKQEDFIDIPNLLLAYNPSYKVYFRHYTQGVVESVMFFV